MTLSTRWTTFFDKPAPNLILRILVMFVGMSFTAFAVALSRTTGLGTSVISCVPAVLSFMTPLSIGVYTFVLNVLFVAVQVALLRRDFNPLQLLCIPFVLVFALEIDFFVPVAETLPMPGYLACLAYTFLACTSTAFGIFLQVKAALIMLPGDGIVLTISKVFGTDFAKTKVAFDSSLMVTGTALSLIGMGGLYGVREGTIIAALVTGLIIGLFNRAFPRFERFAPTEGHVTLTPKDQPATQEVPTDAPLVITIARQYGSGGRAIGTVVADALGAPLYGRELVALVAKESGLDVDYVRRNEQDVRHGILYNLMAQNYAYVGEEPADHDALFLAQAHVVTKLADERPCVIVGRGADQILRDRPNVVRVFVQAPREWRAQRVMERDGLTHAEALARLDHADQERRDHAQAFFGHAWGKEGYDLVIDHALMTTDQAAQAILAKASR